MSKVHWVPDPDRGMRVGVSYDAASDEVVIVHEENVEKVLDINRRAYANSSDQVRRGEEWNHWARIPPGVAMRWKAELGVDIMKAEDWPKIQQLLHDPEWRYLRTAAGDYRTRPAREYYRASSSTNVISKIGRSGARGRIRRQGAI